MDMHEDIALRLWSCWLASESVLCSGFTSLSATSIASLLCTPSLVELANGRRHFTQSTAEA